MLGATVDDRSFLRRPSQNHTWQTRELPSLTSDSVTVPTASTAKMILPRSHIHTSQQTIAALFTNKRSSPKQREKYTKPQPTYSCSRSAHLLMTNCTSSPLKALQSLMFRLTANGLMLLTWLRDPSEEHENTLNKYRCSAPRSSEGLGHVFEMVLSQWL